MAYLILISGFSLLVNLLGIILVLTDLNQRNPSISLVLSQLIFFPISITSLALALVFAPPTDRGSSKSTSMGERVQPSFSHISLSSNPSTESVNVQDV